jgi:hypothetical protein
MSTDQVIYLVLGGAGLGTFAAAIAHWGVRGWRWPLRGPGLRRPPTMPTGPPETAPPPEDEEPFGDEEAQAAADESYVREQHALAAANQETLRKRAPRTKPKPG